MIEISEVLKLERLRIYKTESDKFKFNPDKELVNKLSKVFYPKLKLIFPETLIEKKIASFIYNYSNLIRKDSEKYYFSIGGKENHYGNYLDITDEEVNYRFITN